MKPYSQNYQNNERIEDPYHSSIALTTGTGYHPISNYESNSTDLSHASQIPLPYPPPSSQSPFKNDYSTAATQYTVPSEPEYHYAQSSSLAPSYSAYSPHASHTSSSAYQRHPSSTQSQADTTIAMPMIQLPTPSHESHHNHNDNNTTTTTDNNNNNANDHDRHHHQTHNTTSSHLSSSYQLPHIPYSPPIIPLSQAMVSHTMPNVNENSSSNYISNDMSPAVALSSVSIPSSTKPSMVDPSHYVTTEYESKHNLRPVVSKVISSNRIIRLMKEEDIQLYDEIFEWKTKNPQATIEETLDQFCK